MEKFSIVSEGCLERWVLSRERGTRYRDSFGICLKGESKEKEKKFLCPGVTQWVQLHVIVVVSNDIGVCGPEFSRRTESKGFVTLVSVLGDLSRSK